MSVGYPINVYQESINNVFKEYLVNFNYLKRIMEDYGFVLISRTEAEHMNLPNGTGLFNDLFYWMENEIKRDPNEKYNYKKALYMSGDEKRISFLNRYFIFKKIENISPERLREMDDEKESELEKDYEEKKDNDFISRNEKLEKDLGEESEKEKPKKLEKTKRKKIQKKKMVLEEDKYSPIVEEEEGEEKEKKKKEEAENEQEKESSSSLKIKDTELIALYEKLSEKAKNKINKMNEKDQFYVLSELQKKNIKNKKGV
jgi:hypothetical protein